ncbi:YqaJ viral recombinase family protein [Mycobacterium sp. NAZ190054]|uniref:YqaJ viral recombinase family protein n=1 Tax=Mycobacterium sp. NAZ190054 TaxID=1747766 RepID=UPI0007938405|nr:YqaJ viral recombinase family protein [Mycobacterium sp. NAZ190054]KWX66838.1 hypothetical protein ASJ79_05590 [Mycobacterium sp. NAZ190054]
MTLTIHPELIQGSEAWHEVRRGIITASAVGQLITARKLGAGEYACPTCEVAASEPCVSIAKGKAGAVLKNMHPDRAEYARQQAVTVLELAGGDVARNLTLLLAAERITGWTDPTFISDDMWRGIDDEPKARAKYSEHYAPVTEAGFITEDRWGYQIGYSPDGLVGDDGLIEIKSRRSKAQLATVLADEVPAENMAQLQCGLLVSGRRWIDYISYCGGMPLWVKRVYPQQEWFDAIEKATAAFEANVAEMICRYREATAGLPMTERTTVQEIVI